MTDKKKKADEPTYGAASGELEAILQQIERGDIDLDELSSRVERAAALLTFCQQKLAVTETRVRKVTQELSAAMDVAAGEVRLDDDRADDVGDEEA